MCIRDRVDTVPTVSDTDDGLRGEAATFVNNNCGPRPNSQTNSNNFNNTKIFLNMERQTVYNKTGMASKQN